MKTNAVLFGMLGLAGWIGAQDINLKGVVSNTTGKGISGATVTLVGQKLDATTTADGGYAIIKVASIRSDRHLGSDEISLMDGVLSLVIRESSPLLIEVLDVGGRVVRRESIANPQTGLYRMDLNSSANGKGLLLVRASLGGRTTSFQYLPLSRGLAQTLTSDAVSAGTLARSAAVVDSLRVSASGYQTKTVAISSYVGTNNITLDATNNGLPAPTPSTGCGKDLGSLKAGNNPLKIQSGAYQRDYTINIPNNYNKNNPHRLVFTWHWINASDDAVVNGQVSPGGGANWAYFGLKRMSDSAGVPTIFIAPSSRTGTWGQEDHVLFDDLLKLYKTNLCIDTGRVFATGFSFGAMQTYSLSTGKKQHLRAVATLAAANFNIYLPTYQSNLNIAYLGITGMSDGTCPWDGGTGRGANAIARQHATTNGCTIPGTIPTTSKGSKSHLVYDFQNCKQGYPVKVITFDGGHIAAPADGGTSDNGTTTWAPRESWKFFMQF